MLPKRWSQMNRVEHPPLMMKQLFQGVCGGVRWLETKNLAEYIAKRAVEDGYPSTKAQRKALSAKTPLAIASNASPKAASRVRSRKPPKPTVAAASSPGLVLANSLALSSSGAVVPRAKQRRLVSFDVLDCTFGGGYHTGAVLENGRPYTRVVALDTDPDARENAKEIAREFGSDRFRFYCNRMSEIRAMFGERAFDAIMIDPGPSFTQLEDPERGFLLDSEHSHQCDMRYSCTSGVSALEYLNTVPQHTLASALSAYGLLTPQQSMKMARAIRVGRPFQGSLKLIDAVEEAGNELPEEGWLGQSSQRRFPMSWKFFTSLRGIVNNEKQELQESLRQAFLVLRDGGRLVVFTRLRWEEDLVKDAIAAHPHALLTYTESIEFDQVAEHGHSRHTKMWVSTRVKESAFVLKNAAELTAEKVRESAVRWMGGMFAGQTHGFPAHNFTFEHMEAKEWRTKQRNEAPLPFDHDDEETR